MCMAWETILSAVVEEGSTTAIKQTSLFLYLGAILGSALLLWLVRPESEDNYINGRKLVSVLKGLPFFGNALDFLPENILHTLYTYPSRYGDHIIFFAMFQKCYSIADPVTAKEILVKRPKVFCRQLIMEYAGNRIGVLESVFMARGMVWSQQRRNISPAFNHKNVREYEDDIHLVIREWIQSLSNHSSVSNHCSSVDMLREPFRMTVSVVNRVVFGVSSKSNSNQNEADEDYFNSPQLIDDLLSQFKYIMDSIFYPFPCWTIPYYSPLHKIEQAAIEAAERFRAAVLPIIQHKRELALRRPKLIIDKEGSSAEEKNSVLYKPSMIDHLIVRDSLSVATTSATKGMDKKVELVDNDDILANVRIIYFGGIDTTAVAVSWICFHLAIFPHWVILLRHEIESALFRQKVKTEAATSISLMWFELLSSINFDSIESQLPFCQAFIKETLRCKGPVSGLNHNLELNVPSFTCSNGLKIEASKGFVNINLEGIHHHPEYYEDPWLFRPERWIDATSSAATWLKQQQQIPGPVAEERKKDFPQKKDIPYDNTIVSNISAEHCSSSAVLQRMEEAFLPFGYGPRICPGNKMSLVEQLITLVYLVMMFDLHLECDKREIRRLCSVTSPPNKMPILLQSRK